MPDTAQRMRKQVYELSPQDFTDCPIWEFCPDEEGIEGQDEAIVKPSSETEVPSSSPGAYVVAADIDFGDGAKAVGYIYSGEPGDFGCIQPNVFTHRRIFEGAYPRGRRAGSKHRHNEKRALGWLFR